MLENLLRQGLALLDQPASDHARPAPTSTGRPPARPSADATADRGWPPDERRGMDWRNFGAGAATGSAATGALGLLLGQKQVRRHAGKVLKYGGIAAIGLMAWQARSRWQADSARAGPGAATVAPDAPSRGLPWPQPTYAEATARAWPTPQAITDARQPSNAIAPLSEAQGRALLQAMIAAAKADGHLDAQERALLDAELRRLAADHALRDWMEAELRKPLDPAEVARSAGGDPELAARMYLASLLVADEQNFMERAWLNELARQLGLPPALQARLDAEAIDAQGAPSPEALGGPV